MKRKLSFLSVLLLIVCFSFAQRRESKDVRFEKISDNLYEILDGRGARGGAYIGDSEVLIIDSKMDEKSVKQTIEELKKITEYPIKYLVNTHSDGDHINGNQFFPKETIFISHENCRDDFFKPGRDGSASKWETEQLKAFVPSLTFKNKIDLYIGVKKVELWYFGVGHTTGDAVIYFPEEKTAFLGDQIFSGRAQLIHKHKNGNSFEHVKTLSRMLNTLEAEKFCSGHSEITDRFGIMDHIYQMKKRQQKIKTMLRNGESQEIIRNSFSDNEKALVNCILDEIINGGY